MIGIASSTVRKQKTAYTADEFNLLAAGASLVNLYHSGITACTLTKLPPWTLHAIVGSAECSYPEINYLRRVESGERCVVFDKGLALELHVVNDCGTVIVSDERFGFYGSGYTYQEALADYGDFFVDFFEDIVSTPNADLPPSTREFRRTLLAFGKLVRIG